MHMSKKRQPIDAASRPVVADEAFGPADLVPTAAPLEAFDMRHAFDILFRMPTELERPDNWRSYPPCIHSARLGDDD